MFTDMKHINKCKEGHELSFKTELFEGRVISIPCSECAEQMTVAEGLAGCL